MGIKSAIANHNGTTPAHVAMTAPTTKMRFVIRKSREDIHANDSKTAIGRAAMTAGQSPRTASEAKKAVVNTYRMSTAMAFVLLRRISCPTTLSDSRVPSVPSCSDVLPTLFSVVFVVYLFIVGYVIFVVHFVIDLRHLLFLLDGLL